MSTLSLSDYNVCRDRIYCALDGFYITADELDTAVMTFLDLSLYCPDLPIADLRQAFGVFGEL